MNDFLTGLFNGLMQELQLPAEDPGHEQAVQGYLELEAQVKEKLGPTLLTQFQRTQSRAFCWDDITVFACGLRFGAQFALAVFSPQSSQTSAP
mgnify:CR=1 FL=1